MKKFSLVKLFLVVMFATTIIIPFNLKAVESKKKTINKYSSPYVFIHYGVAPKGCTRTTNDQVNRFGWTGWKLPSGITEYKINFNTLPRGITRQTAQGAIDGAFSNLQAVGNGILFRNAGETNLSIPSNDGQNIIYWSNLPASYVGVTYAWTDGQGRLQNADTVFNRRYTWNSTNYNGQNDCGGTKASFDIQNIATHEFGHWMGLGDLYDSASKDLTMYGYASRSELKKDTLGLGDRNGILAVWP